MNASAATVIEVIYRALIVAGIDWSCGHILVLSTNNDWPMQYDFCYH